MTKDIFLSILLNEAYSENKIINVLNRGRMLNFKYYQYKIAEKYFDSPACSNKEIIDKILISDEHAPVLCKYQDTGFFIYFNASPITNFLEVSLGCTNYPWKKEFFNGEKTIEYDMQRYLRLMLKLVDDLKITKIEAKIEWD